MCSFIFIDKALVKVVLKVVSDGHSLSFAFTRGAGALFQNGWKRRRNYILKEDTRWRRSERVVKIVFENSPKNGINMAI